MKTFHHTRLKLTAWYLLIIMTLSILFSLVIYKALKIEVDRFERAQRFFIERRLYEGNLPPSPPFNRQLLNPELVNETKQRILFMLIITNIGIFFITGGLAYFLAGRTLKPIKEMMDKQRRFISDASHELKTPLTALRSEFEVAIMDEKKLELKEAKALIKSGLEEIVNLQGLAENLLEITQQQKKIGALKTEEISLLDIVESALKKVIPLARKKQITINNQIDDIILKGESHSLTQLFVILLDNAIKYSHKDSRIDLTSQKTDHQITIYVKDTGIGIAEEDIPHIFDRFYRVDKSRSETHGYGLGLSIAKQIIETHKGFLDVQSDINKGSVFIVRLPIIKA